MTEFRPALHYGNVDQAENAGLCFSLMDQLRAEPDVQTLQAEALAILQPEPGQRILDLGCGTGDLSRRFAASVAPDGQVTGVDVSEAMVKEAIRRSDRCDLPVTFEPGDARALPFGSETFDACWSERMLSHVPDPAAAVAEMVRVVRPGGLVLIVDIDVAGTMIDHPDESITAAFLNAMFAPGQTAWMGRQLRRLMTRSGLVDLVLRPKIIELSYPTLNAMMDSVASEVVATGAASSQAMESWAQDLVDAAKDGTFFMAITLFMAAGTKPLMSLC